VIIFCSDMNGPGRRLFHDIQRKMNGHRIAVDRSVEALSKRLRSPMRDRVIMVLVAENRERLEAFISLGDLMNDAPILLVLPDREPATISFGHKLYPRFVAYLDSDFSDLVSVLCKLLDHGRAQHRFPESVMFTGLQKQRMMRWKKISPAGAGVRSLTGK
jgi:hypothetical protein